MSELVNSLAKQLRVEMISAVACCIVYQEI